MSMRINMTVVCLVIGGLLSGCATKKTIPKVPKLTTSINIKQVWTNNTKQGEYTHFAPQLIDTQLVDAGNDQIKIMDVEKGTTQRQIKLKKKIVSGVGTNGSIFVVASNKGELHTYSNNGELLWQTQASSEILAPAVVTNDGYVITRTIDGRITAYAQEDGKQLWQFMRPIPALALRNYAPVTAVGGLVFAGLANGQVVGLVEKSAGLVWEGQVAIPKGTTELERAVDVLSRPLIIGQTVCVVAYQGKVGCFDATNGTPIWNKDMASGTDLASDDRALFGVTSQAEVLAFDVTDGSLLWRMDKLKGRELGAPVVFGQYLVFGDMEGYVYFLNKASGEIEGVRRLVKAPIKQQPIVYQDMVLIKSTKGHLVALRV